jgi:hypothetical protein
MKKVLIAQPMLESSIGAYIEWLGKESKMANDNKYKYKDALLVMLSAMQ